MSDDLKSLIKNILILIVVLALAYFLASQFGNLYVYFFPQPIGHGNLLSFPTSRAFENGLIGLPLSYTFFLTLLFTAFGGAKKYWWIGILLIPAVIFEVYFDLSRIYFPLAIGLLGWLLGWAVSKLLPKSN